MHNLPKQALANAVRQARIEQKISQERLSEILGIDKRTLGYIETEEGNPTFENLYKIITYLNIPVQKVFYPNMENPRPNLQKLLAALNDCTEQEADTLFPAVLYLLSILRK